MTFTTFPPTCGAATQLAKAHTGLAVVEHYGRCKPSPGGAGESRQTAKVGFGDGGGSLHVFACHLTRSPFEDEINLVAVLVAKW